MFSLFICNIYHHKYSNVSFTYFRNDFCTMAFWNCLEHTGKFQLSPLRCPHSWTRLFMFLWYSMPSLHCILGADNYFFFAIQRFTKEKVSQHGLLNTSSINLIDSDDGILYFWVNETLVGFLNFVRFWELYELWVRVTVPWICNRYESSEVRIWSILGRITAPKDVPVLAP